MTLPLQLSRSTIEWTPEGYLLRITSFMGERTAHLFREAIEGELRSVGGDLRLEGITPAEWWHNDRGSGVEPGELRLIARRLLTDVDPVGLHLLLERTAAAVAERVEEESARDDEAARRFLNALGRVLPPDEQRQFDRL